MQVAVLSASIGAGVQFLVPLFKHMAGQTEKQTDATAAALVKLVDKVSDQSREIGALATEVHGFGGTNGLKGELREMRAAVQRVEERVNGCQMGRGCR